MTLLHQPVTEQIIGAAFDLYNHLGYGFLEKVYKNAMKVELGLRGVPVALEEKIDVYFERLHVGVYFVDLWVSDRVIVELKVAGQLTPADPSPLLNELQASGVKVGLLINFGKEKLEFNRLVY